MNFLQKHCVPCEGGVARLTREEAEYCLKETPGWTLSEDATKITRQWKCADFAEAMIFVNRVAEIAEEQDHHPDILIQYSRVTLTLWTHAIGGLSENDCIVAAYINALEQGKVGKVEA